MTTSRRRSGPDDPVTAWCRDVLADRFVSGDLAKHSAERHLRDLKDGARRGLYWDPEAAQHVIDWYPTMLQITAGEFAGRPFHLLPHTMFMTGSIFGWKYSNGRRRFRTAWLETGKGQAKTPWMAATGLYMLRFLRIPRFEGYAIAGNENQSGLIIKDAAEMARAMIPGEDVTFETKTELIIRGTGALVWQIEWDGTADGLGTCFLRNVSSGSKISGPKPSFLAADEIHEWNDRDLLETWQAALTKMPGDPLMLMGTNTPAADQILAEEQSDFYAAVARGDVVDDSSLSLICTVDDGDKPFEDESCWRKALPALDITYPASNVREEVVKARNLPGKKLTVSRLFFGIRTGATDCWIDYPLWSSIIGQIDDDELVGLPCWLGLDLSSRKDLTALAAVWKRPDGHLFARIFYWTPKATLLQRVELDRAPYDQWVASGYLTATPGPTIAKSWPAQKVLDMTNAYDVRVLSYDPAQILDFEEAAAEVGLDMWMFEGIEKAEKEPGEGLMRIRHGQGFKGLDREDMLNMPTSVKALEEVILQGRITIEESPVTNFCSANMTLMPGANPDQKVPNRRKARGRIDGLVALIEAVGAAESPFCADTIIKPPSVYEGRGILTI